MTPPLHTYTHTYTHIERDRKVEDMKVPWTANRRTQDYTHTHTSTQLHSTPDTHSRIQTHMHSLGGEAIFVMKENQTEIQHVKSS